MNFLFLTQYYPPEGGSASIKMSEIAEYFANKGHGVTVVTGFPNYPQGKIYEGYNIKLLMREKNNGVNIVRVPLYMTSKKYSFKHRMLNHVSFMLSSMYGGGISKKPDLIYYYSPPIFVGFSAWVLGRRFKVPVVADINDLWPQAPIAMGIIKNRGLKKFAERYEKFVYKKTDYLFFYSETMRRKVIERGVPPERTEIHPLWISKDEFIPASNNEVNDFKQQFGFDGKFIVMYAGYIGLPQGLDILIDVAKELKEYRDFLFLIVGDGPERDNLVRKTKDYKLDNVRFIPFQPKNKIPLFLSSADILFVHLDPAPHRLGTIPAKVLAYMSIGKPILAAAIGETQELITRYKVGISIEPRNVDSIASGILMLYKNPELRHRMGKAGRQCIAERFDKDKVLDGLENRLVEIAKCKK